MGQVPKVLSQGINRWRYPTHWIPPLKWYWGQIEEYIVSNPVSESGVSWIELAMDFEIATRTMLTGKSTTKKGTKYEVKDGKGQETVSQRAYNFAAASRRILKICNNEKLPSGQTVSTLVAYGGRPIAGLQRRVKLLNPRAVFKELATQAVTYRTSFAAGAPTGKQWKWQPRFIGLPPQVWHAQPYAILTKVNLKRRLKGKQSPLNLHDDRRKALPHPDAGDSHEVHALGEGGAKRRITKKRSQQEGEDRREGTDGESLPLNGSADHASTNDEEMRPLRLQHRLVHVNSSRSFLSTRPRRVPVPYERSAP
jgi:hypothetical protein